MIDRSLNEDGVYLGIDLGASNVRTGLVRGQQLLDVKSAAIDSDRDVDHVFAQIFELIDEAWTDEIVGMGMGVPSVVDIEEGIVYDVQNIPAMKEVPAKRMLEERYGCAAFVNNDVNCFVLGEQRFGKAQGYRHVAGLNLGTGFAAGLILDGALYEGPNCGAGEFGMVPYQESILENYCSGLYFIGRGLDAAAMHDLAEEGDEVAISLWEEFGRHLGQALKIVLYTIDPEIIVLGGSIRKAYRHFEAAMWTTVNEFAYKKTLERLVFEVSELEHAALLGASVLPRLRHQTSA